MNGEPLPHWHGAPARLVVAGWTATYWVKHLTSISVEPKAFDGFWMKSAYRIPTGAFPGARFASQENAATTPITEILINSLVTSHVERRPAATRSTCGARRLGLGRRQRHQHCRDLIGRRTLVAGDNAGRSAELLLMAWIPRGSRYLETRPAAHCSPRNRRQRCTQPEKLTPNPSGYHHNIIQTLTLEVA